MLRDVEYFSSKLGNLDGFGDAGDFLAGIVNAKEVQPEAPVEQPLEATEAKEDEEPKAGHEAEHQAKDEAKDEAKDGPKDEAEIQHKGDGPSVQSEEGEAPVVEEPATKAGDKL